MPKGKILGPYKLRLKMLPGFTGCSQNQQLIINKHFEPLSKFYNMSGY